jgi:glycosyltransferase involved in cell wall biosynthesis
MILFIDGIIFGRETRGGISRVWVEYLKRLQDYGPDIRLLVPFFHRNQWLLDFERHCGKVETQKSLFFWPKRYWERTAVRDRLLKAAIGRRPVDVFHSTYFSTIKDKRIKKIMTIYDMIHERLPHIFNTRWDDIEIQKKKAALKNADKIIAISESTKRDLLDFYPWVKEDRVAVITPGALHLGKPALFEDVKGRFGFDAAPGGFFLFVGNRDRYKNFCLLESLLLEKPGKRDELFICVGGENSVGTSARLKEKGLRRSFIFLGDVPDRDLAALYRGAKAVIFPSEYEGFGLPVLEALANSCPVLCGNNSSLPEAAGDAAFYFDVHSTDSLAEAMKRLSAADRDEVIRRGEMQASRFSWDRAVEQLVAVYANNTK